MNPHDDPLRHPRFARLLEQMRGQAAPEPSADFTERVLAAVAEAKPPRVGWFDRVLRIAAALAVAGGAWWLARPATRMEVARDLTPIEILMAAQRPDGSWSADAQDLRPRYDTGVTALVLLALIHADAAPPAGARAGRASGAFWPSAISAASASAR